MKHFIPLIPEKPINKGLFGDNSTNVTIESSFVLCLFRPFALPLQPKCVS